MSENINVESGSIAGQLSQFQSEMANMQTLFSELEAQTSSITSSWQGEGSDAVIGSIKNFLTVFDTIKAQNDKYVSFLNGVIDRYTAMDNNLSSSTESSGLGINGS